MRKTITVHVNGIVERHEVEPNLTLLSFLRETLNLTGAKEGCNEGECGACMVLLDGKAVNSCLMLAVEADGRQLTTIEGLGDSKQLHPLQKSFLAHHAVQCGFCSPGMILTAVSLLGDNPNPTEDEIRHALAGNLCRCTGYKQIIESIQAAASEIQASPRQARGERKERRTA